MRMPLIQGCNSDGEVMSSFYVEHKPVDQDSGGPSLTRQEFAEECDLNALMARYENTGQVVSHVNAYGGAYMDLSEVPDLQRAMELMDTASRAFMSLPAKVRREFDNDPKLFVQFAEDPENIAQLRDWGLAAPLPAEPTPMKVEVINPPQEPPKAP